MYISLGRVQTEIVELCKHAPLQAYIKKSTNKAHMHAHSSAGAPMDRNGATRGGALERGRGAPEAPAAAAGLKAGGSAASRFWYASTRPITALRLFG